MSIKESPGALAGAPGAKTPIQTAKDDASSVSRKARRGNAYHITPTSGTAFVISVQGRTNWALDQLGAAGARGCIPIADPAPRWSAYIVGLRELGVEIETVTEPHGGEFAGHHARYVLRCQAVPVAEGGVS